MKQLQERIEKLIPQINALLDSERLDEFEVRATEYLKRRLAEMRDEAVHGVLSQSPVRKGEIARIVAEFDPHVLAPVLGGALMDIEAEYYALR